jgi:hypothetical protein
MGVRGDVVPGGDAFRAAVKWLSDRRTEPNAPPLWQLLEEAARQFDLSPREVESLKALVLS